MTGLIAAATAALVGGLRARLDPEVAIATGHPADAPHQGLSLNLFLYSVRQISVRAAPPPLRDAAGRRPQPQVTLGLSLLVTAFDGAGHGSGEGAGGGEDSRALLEAVVAWTLENPVLPPSGPLEVGRLAWLPFEESVARIWPLLSLPYRTSLGWDLAATGRLGA